MIKKTLHILAAVVAILFASCEKYDNAISDIEKRLDEIEGNSLTSISQQIDAINGSIDNLKAVDAELKGYIESLETTAADLQSKIDATNEKIDNVKKEMGDEIDAVKQNLLNKLNELKTEIEGQLATINNTIAVLQAKDAELDQKIANLQTYVDNELANYATTDWANATFSTLKQYEATQTAISQINALIKSTQESIAILEEKLNKKIADNIAAAIAGVNADIAAKVTEITNGYTTAIANATDAVTAAYTDAIKTAITASETSMKEWVNSVLAEGYYTKAEIDGKITALQTQVAEGDAVLQKEIDDLEAALEKANSDLTAAYEKAIKDAVADGGIINAAIAAAVRTAQDNLQAQIDAINGEIEKIKARLDIIEADINSINQQIAAINGSIDDLKEVNKELDGYIKSLQNTAADLQSQIDDTNDRIQSLETNATQQADIDALKDAKTALETDIATINNTIATLTSQLNAIEDKIVSLESAVANCATQEELDAVKQELATVQSETAEVKTAIKNLQDRMTAVEGEVDSLQTAVADLQSRVEKLEELFNQIQSVTFIPQYSDGKVELDYGSGQTSLDFMINPQRLSTALVSAWNGNNEIIKAYVRYTNDPTTRAVADPIELTVADVTSSTGGMINITVKDNNPSLLSEDFWLGKQEAVIYIVITNGVTEIASDVIPMIAHNYAGNANTIGGYGDGDSQSGEAGQ